MNKHDKYTKPITRHERRKTIDNEQSDRFRLRTKIDQLHQDRELQRQLRDFEL